MTVRDVLWDRRVVDYSMILSVVPYCCCRTRKQLLKGLRDPMMFTVYNIQQTKRCPGKRVPMDVCVVGVILSASRHTWGALSATTMMSILLH